MKNHQPINRKKKLYRRVNTTAHFVFHHHGGGYRWERAKQKLIQENMPYFLSMKGKQRRGLDYTPLFMFLLSKVGEKWDLVYSEAIQRLDKPEPIFWMVALHEHEQRDYICCGESSYYNGLFVDESGILRKVNPNLSENDITIHCQCCTYTFNGVPIHR
ncbi:hypothetical protein Xmau_04185 [Xenorhabdus mauleonii]|uniref:Uncharacterized protein n=1 Tax=Xenorhabdus mauleonii TaxID=351675 RepID=A0A1I3WYK0_9GAMM|nr:hypothetical protein [Xenorhabdus mauleonii]PHM36647.1 hypothetical protein Xmau_04185 [Xenorhabdus mauleonii]SFK11541.1 hypothetical protein SAMN05421680_1303 [Xenorhabdus mauleonii]